MQDNAELTEDCEMAYLNNEQYVTVRLSQALLVIW